MDSQFVPDLYVTYEIALKSKKGHVHKTTSLFYIVIKFLHRYFKIKFHVKDFWLEIVFKPKW